MSTDENTDAQTPVALREGVRNLFVGNKRTEDNREFGRLLRVHRMRAGLSAASVAEAVGVSASFVRSIERGDQAPSKSTAEAILSTVGLNPDATPLELTDPDTNQTYRIIAFTASRKGDNSRWSLARLAQGRTQQETTERFAELLGNSSIGDKIAHTQAEEEARKQRLALGIYGISDDEPAAETRNRIYRRLGLADAQEVVRIHAFLDDLGVADPLDHPENYWAEGYPSREEL
jgi:DNA-binding XRE family transcriptional regulator